jgi:Spy/CpxP family protein refolding chaperone
MRLRKLLLLMATLPLLLPAQSRRDLFPWWDSPLAHDLNLTDAQQKQIRATVKEYRDRLVDLRAAVEKADGDLKDVFNEDPVEQNKANAAIDRLASARGELTRTLSQMTLKLRTTLTAQQWQELQRRQLERPGFGVPGRPGFGSRRRDSTSPAPVSPDQSKN